MQEISITESGFGTMCRLCLSSDTAVALSDIFCFSSDMKSTVAGVITKYAAVQITRDDKMPNFICQSCYIQLEKTHQFLMQIEQSDRTLRRYLQHFYASDKPIIAESSVQTSKDPLNDTPNNDIVKCESLELNNVFDADLNWKATKSENVFQENENNKNLCLKSEIKVEPIDANLFLTIECETCPVDNSSTIDGKEFGCEDAKIEETEMSQAVVENWKEKEQKNHILTNKLMEKMSPKSEIKVEKMDDDSFILPGSVNDMVNASSNCDGTAISCEDTQINIGNASENSYLSSINLPENFSTSDETHKNTSINRKKHKKSNISKSFNCDICDKCFSGASGLFQHKRTHTGEKPYNCDLCNKCFFRLSHLRTHELEHTGAKPYQCDLCNMCFARSSDLKRHKLNHAGEKPYQCDICDKRFMQSGNLNLHKRIHTGEKPYLCDLCSMCFARSSNLNRHKLKHAGEKPYSCDLCSKSFARSSHLNRHKLKHAGAKP